MLRGQLLVRESVLEGEVAEDESLFSKLGTRSARCELMPRHWLQGRYEIGTHLRSMDFAGMLRGWGEGSRLKEGSLVSHKQEAAVLRIGGYGIDGESSIEMNGHTSVECAMGDV